MPVTQLKNIAKKASKSLSTVEGYWGKAKKIAARKGNDIKSKWGFVTYLTKKMAGITEQQWLTEGLEGHIHGYLESLGLNGYLISHRSNGPEKAPLEIRIESVNEYTIQEIADMLADDVLPEFATFYVTDEDGNKSNIMKGRTPLFGKGSKIGECKLMDISENVASFEKFWEDEEWIDKEYQLFLEELADASSKSIEVLPDKVLGVDLDRFISNMSKIGFVIHSITPISDKELQIKTETSVQATDKEIQDAMVNQIQVTVDSDKKIPDYSMAISLKRDLEDHAITTFTMKTNGYKVAVAQRDRNWFLPA